MVYKLLFERKHFVLGINNQEMFVKSIVKSNKIVKR